MNKLILDILKYMSLFNSGQKQVLKEQNDEIEVEVELEDPFIPENFGYIIVYLLSQEPSVAGKLFEVFLELFLNKNGISAELIPGQQKTDIDINNIKYQLKFSSLYKADKSSYYITYPMEKSSNAPTEFHISTKILTDKLFKTIKEEIIPETNLIEYLKETDQISEFENLISDLIKKSNKFLEDFANYFSQNFIIVSTKRIKNNLYTRLLITSFTDYLKNLLDFEFEDGDLFFEKEGKDLIRFYLKNPEKNIEFYFNTTRKSKEDYKNLYGSFFIKDRHLFRVSNISTIHFFPDVLDVGEPEKISIKDVGRNLIDYFSNPAQFNFTFHKYFSYSCVEFSDVLKRTFTEEYYALIVKLVKDLHICEI